MKKRTERGYARQIMKKKKITTTDLGGRMASMMSF